MKRNCYKLVHLRSALASLFVLFSLSVSAQYYQMVVHTDDGLTFPFNTNRVNDVQFVLMNPDDSGNDEDETTVTGSATDITAYTATITSWANILDNLSTDLKVGIIYSTNGTPSKSNGTQRTVSTSSLGSDAKYTIKLTDLAPSTTYYYRSFVYQSGVWFYGNVKEFTTKGQGVVSGEVSKLTCYSAKVGGSISIDKSTLYSTLSYGICYGTGSNPTVNDSKVQANSKDQDGNFVCQLRALSGSTTYYYRAYVYVDNHLTYGSVRSFTTKDDDVVITGDIDIETFTVKSTLKIGSGAYSSLELGVCYGTTENPTVNYITITTNEVDDESNYTLTLKDCPVGTVYYRAFVKIDGVAHYGEVKSFLRERILNGYEYVDLGLSVKWATFNVGATAPEEAGDYFAWGEVQTKEDYKENNYKWYNGGSYDIIKYNATDNKTTLDLDDDVARVLWGGEWRMPTKEEFQELMDNCTWIWKENGYEVKSNKTDYADKSIFIPAAGIISGGELGSVGSMGYYWTSSLNAEKLYGAYGVMLMSFMPLPSDFQRYDALTVRPVCP